MRKGRVAWAEVDSVEISLGEVGDVRPCLLRLDVVRPGRLQRSHRRRVGDDPAGGGVADDLERRAVRDQRGEERLRLGWRAIWWIPEVHGCDRLAGNDVVGDPGLQARHRKHLPELQPADDGNPRLELEQAAEPVHRALERAVGQPGPRRVAARAVEREARDDVSQAPGLDLQVGRLENDRKSGVVDGERAVEQRRERVVLGRELFASEEQQREIAACAFEVDVPRQLDCDCEAALHVTGAEPVHRAVDDPARQVRLRRDRVVVRCQQDEGMPGSPGRHEEKRLVSGELALQARRHETEQVLANRSFVAALGRDVDELERPRAEAVGERGHRGSVQRHNPAVTARQPDPAPGAEPERGFLLGVYPKGPDGGLELRELEELARTAGVLASGELVQQRARPDIRTFVGKGKLTELQQSFADAAAEVLVVDDELSPTQQRTLEDALKTRVVDRTQLILDIFAQHARSSEGKLQVELAQLEYNLPRMRGMWHHLERLGGGVGTRGPGESQLETDRRLARTRVALLKKRLRGLAGQRATRRKERRRTSVPTIALAGYTNVGKSTLLNALTGAHASVDDRLFETLDPTTRAFEHDGKRYLVTDTVGFIRRLPTQLVEGFAATLEETLVADLVLHVADAALAEDRLAETIAAVRTVLTEIGADDIPIELVLNKVDALGPLARRRVEHAYPRALLVSASTGEGLESLKSRIADLFSDRFEDVRLLVPYSDGKTLAALYDLGAPIAERRDTAEGVHVRARLPRAEASRFARYLVAGDHDLEQVSAR